MSFASLLATLTLLSSLGGVFGQSYNCTQNYIPVNVNVNASQINYATPANQSDFTGLVTDAFLMTSNTSELVNGSTTINGSYNIWSSFCVPQNFSDNGTLEFAVHGIGLDHTYWEINGNNSEYNYVESALNAGHAVFTFDRLGSGMSSTPDGVKDVQTAVELAVVDSLLTMARNGSLGYNFSTIVGTGHSYGSILLAALVAQNSSVVDGLVLTGFSTYTGSLSLTFAAEGLALANEVNSDKFGSLDNGYGSSVSPINIQQMFFHYPNYPSSTFNWTLEHPGVMTVGELLTISSALAGPAQNFTGPVMVVTGDKDLPFCGGNCYQSQNGSANLVEPSKQLFPSASNFSSYLQPGAGHANIAHYGAADAFSAIQDFIASSFA